MHKKKQPIGCLKFYIKKSYSSITAFSFFLYFHSSLKYPTIQYGITKVNKKIINQNPMVKMVKKSKNPEYCEKSIRCVFILAQN